MRSRTGVLAVILGLAAAATITGFIQRSTVPASVGSPDSLVPLQPSVPSMMHVLVGDTVRLRRIIGPLRQLAVGFTSSDTNVAVIDTGGVAVAKRVGSTTLVAARSANETGRVSVVLTVTTRREAVNMMLLELCPNQDEGTFRDSLWIDSDVPLVHEYHDCQRLINQGANARLEYGPLVGVLAHRNVAASSRAAYSNGRLAAVVVNFATKNRISRYEPLRLAPGTNCVVLRSQGARWQAAVIAQPQRLSATGVRRYGTCSDSMVAANVPRRAWTDLEVREQHAFDPNGEPIVPAVARWDWDSVNNKNYLGVKCGSAWCEIGERGFTPSTPRLNRYGQDLIKGYYDEQYLAVVGGAGPSNVFGTLTPGPDAGDAAMSAPGTRWYRISNIALRTTGNAHAPEPETIAFYIRKFQLRLSQARPGVRPVATGSVTVNKPEISVPPVGNKDYRVRIDGKSIPRWFMAFTHHPSEPNKLPTVRWRWEANDESTWSYCDPDGCCEHRGTDQS